LASGERGRHSAAELLRAATASGYASLGMPDGGRIEPGALADLTTISFDSARLAGVPPSGAVFCATAADVRHVMVGGRWVVRDREHVSIDVAAELRDALA
jgi:cytosine/adenosine deaminase-related metal-dependent hydrolase